MTAVRQNDLLAGDNWTTLYRAFTSINFNATDPVSINAALQNYIQTNYPENFNDWVLSSEFVAIIDLLAWLAGTLAFRTDIAARENFIDTAEARESVLRLARFLSYNPSRCQPATGMLKVLQVTTDDDVTDSFGASLTNVPVQWNDPNNSNWLEQFTLIMNNAFVTTNPFGVPLSDGLVGGTTTQLYRVNGLASANNLSFSSTVSGTGMDFEVCNGDFTDGVTLFERAPDPLNAMHLFYLNDGNGNDSVRSGFFLLFKQGSTLKQIFNISQPVQNQLLDIGSININQNDVWVATVDDNGAVLIDWAKVSTVYSSNNITYNNLSPDQRYIFSVITRDNDQISIRFADGNFGNAPVGNIAISYRVSNALEYQIKPSEIDHITVPLSYFNPAGVAKTLNLTVSLTEPVSNAAASETIEQIRQRAPQVYATQNRMVSGEDYNTFPLTSNLAVKIKAVNRIYSGQSRYIDLHDPTGTFKDLSIFADDGILFRDSSDTYFEVPLSLNKTPDQLFNDYIRPTIDQYTTANLIRDVLMQNVLNGVISAPTAPALRWVAASGNLFTTTGWFSGANILIQPGAIIQFSIRGVLTWVAVVDVQSAINAPAAMNTAGPVKLSQEVPDQSTVMAILPQALTILPASVITQIISNLNLKLSFSLWYDYQTNGGTWVVLSPQNDFGGQPALDPNNLLLIMNVNFITGLWRINSQGVRYVFESLASVQWYDNGRRSFAEKTGEAAKDSIRVLRINQDLHAASRGFALGVNYDLTIDRLWTYPDGTSEPRRTTVNLADSNGDTYPDQPDAYFQIVGIDSDADKPNSYLFWSSLDDPPFDQPIYDVRVYESDILRINDAPVATGTVAFQLSNESFWVKTATGWQADFTAYRARRGRGPNVAASWVTADATLMPFSNDISFHWKHYAPSDHRINPASTNIIDIFVLTAAYDLAVRQWIVNGALPLTKPVAPSELDLSIAFSSLETSKMFSDSIVWRPVRYKFLFGSSADPSVQAQFKIVRVSNATVSDGEIQSKVITAINAFFDIARWDFGETFYFTEMAAFIHQQLVGLISSIVIVPRAANASFGDGFEIPCNADEIFISTAQVSDLLLISTNTAINLRIA